MERSENGLEFATTPEPEVRRRPINLLLTLVICFVGWLVPGLSHFLLGKWIRGAIFTICVVAMFVLGLGMHGKLFDLVIQEPLQIFAFIANLGVGIPYFLAEKWGMGVGGMNTTTYDYGTTYLWVAGLLNYLIVLDAFDVAQGRKP
jgi:hypothetical protein